MKKLHYLGLLLSSFANLCVSAQEDVTHRIENADFSQGNAGWSCEMHNIGSASYQWTADTGTRPAVIEAYSGFEVLEMDSFKIYQEITLEAGMYRLYGHAFYRWGSSYTSDINNADGKGARSQAWLFAGEQHVNVMRLGDVDRAALRPTDYANTMIEASAAFGAGLYRNTLIFETEKDTTLQIGFYGTNDRKQCWFIAGPVTLERISEQVLQEEAAAEITAWMGRYSHLKDICASIACQHPSETAFDPTEADLAVQTAQHVEQIQGAIRMLTDALGNYMLQSTEMFDITALIDNPGFETGDLGKWSSLTVGDTGVRENSNKLYSMTGAEGNFLFNTYDISETTANDHHVLQTLDFMPAGSYRLTAELATNQTAQLKLSGGNASVAVNSPSATTTTRASVDFTLKENGSIRIGATSDMWFKADDFHLYFFNGSYVMREDLMTTLDGYETIASQASDRSAYDATLEEVESMMAAITTKSQADSLKSVMHAAILDLIENVPATYGVYDLTLMVKNASFTDGTKNWYCSSATTTADGIAEVFDNTETYTLRQTMTQMPKGWYMVTAKAFSRTTDYESALNTCLTGTQRIEADLTLDSKKTPLKSIFDDSRFTTTSTGFEYYPMPDGSSVPNTMIKAAQIFGFGHYNNVLRYEKTTEGNLSFGISMSNAKANNWLAFDDFHLYYGKVKEVCLDTLRTPEGIYANISSQRILKAGVLEAVCLPYDADMSSFEAVYVLGSATSEKALLIPATEMKAGHTYFVRVAQDQPITASDILLTAVLPDSIPALWNGTFQKGAYQAGTAVKAHILNADGTQLEYVDEKDVPAGTPRFYLAASQDAEGIDIPIEIHEDWMDMSFNATIENFKVEEFISNNTYNRETPSVVSTYHIAPVCRRDQPRSVAIPMPALDSTPKRITVVYSEHEDLSDSVSTRISKYSKQWFIYNLIPNRTYYYKVIADDACITKGQFTTQGRVRMLRFNSGSNIRDLGGWTTEDGKTVCYGKIYRGGELHAGFETNMSNLDLKDFEELGIKAEFDLRNNDQVENNVGPSGSALGADVPYRYMNQYLFGDDALIQDTLIYRTAFKFFADNLNAGRPVYFHCIWGADRTGAMAMLVNGLLGVGEDQLYKDYELTSFSKAGLREKIGLDSKFDYLATFGGTIQEQIYRYLNEYVKVPTSQLDDIIRHMLHEDSDAIHEMPAINLSSEDAPIYDLMGRKVDTPTQRGIYIRNGKKFIVR